MQSEQNAAKKTLGRVVAALIASAALTHALVADASTATTQIRAESAPILTEIVNTQWGWSGDEY